MTREDKLRELKELKSKAVVLKREVDYYNALQLALKLVLNGSYGAFATSYFVLFNNNVAGTITAEGRALTKKMDEKTYDYWHYMWHKDYELHERMGLRDVREIDKSIDVGVYGDTDSCERSTIINTTSGDKTIEDWYNENMKNGSGGNTKNGHESVLTSDKVLNYSEELGIYQAPVKRIIRHNVSKAKWKLKTKSGKEIVITNDHSMIVFRNGRKIEVKPCDILHSDKILVLKR